MTSTSPRWRHLLAAVLCLVAVAGCSGPGDVRFDRERCYIDGQPAGLAQVEAREAIVEHRIAVRQPWLVIITVAVVLLAGVGYVEKLVLVFSASRDSKGLADRLRTAAERYRAHRLRYFALVGGSVGLLATAGFLYIYADADKRSNERALAALQFCHLALRTGEETSALDQQRQNLASIHETAGEIRQLIDKLPPAEQVKAQEIIGHMDDAVGRERRLLTDQLQRSESTAEAIRDGTLSIEKTLAAVQGAVGALRDLPAGVKSLGETLQAADERRASSETEKIADLTARLEAVQKAVDGLASRPPPRCPACVCAAPPRLAAAVSPALAAQVSSDPPDPKPAAKPEPDHAQPDDKPAPSAPP
jgi:hypothetical protein